MHKENHCNTASKYLFLSLFLFLFAVRWEICILYIYFKSHINNNMPHNCNWKKDFKAKTNKKNVKLRSKVLLSWRKMLKFIYTLTFNYTLTSIIKLNLLLNTLVTQKTFLVFTFGDSRSTLLCTSTLTPPIYANICDVDGSGRCVSFFRQIFL